MPTQRERVLTSYIGDLEQAVAILIRLQESLSVIRELKKIISSLREERDYERNSNDKEKAI